LVGDCGMHMCYAFSLSYAFCYIALSKCILSIGVSLIELRKVDNRPVSRQIQIF
jgi:hypothetical protein